MMRRWLGWPMLLLLLMACAPSVPPSPASSTVPTSSPRTLTGGETVLCRKATRLVLSPTLIPEGAERWALLGASGEVLRAGGLEMGSEAAFPFPHGEPLPPGSYRVALLDAAGEMVAFYPFRITERPPQLETLHLLLTPDGPQVDTLPAGTRLFYVRYTYRDACQGSPLWLTVERGPRTICSQMTTLAVAEGEGILACYRQGGQVLEGGKYRLLLTLADETVRGLSFTVAGGEPPLCDPPLVATAIAPDGTLFRAQTRFEWYTEALYLVLSCRNLHDGLLWQSRWYREGHLVRKAQGLWHGGEVGQIWDSLTGSESDPFLKPGAYTATMALNGVPFGEVAFRILPYVKRD